MAPGCLSGPLPTLAGLAAGGSCPLSRHFAMGYHQGELHRGLVS